MFDISNEVEHRDNQDKQQFWQDQVEAWKQSGTSQAEYCRRHDLNI